MKEVQVSIIIPCYNCEALIDETLDSLVNQTFKNFEVICVNDGSRDNTLQKLEAWSEKGCLNMRLVNQENAGVSRARNVGISEAAGRYILFLDSDDCLHPEFIKRLVQGVELSGADVSYCLLSRDRKSVFGTVLSEDNWYAEQNQAEMMHNLLYRMGEIGFYCYIYETSTLRENNIFFDEKTRFFEDREFNWKYLCHCQSAALINQPLYWYRVNPNSVTQNKTVRWITEDLDAVIRVEQYLFEHECEFYPELKSYLFSRVIWGKAKRFAVGRSKELFRRLMSEYDVRSCMKRTAKDKNKLVALASRLYLIHPSLFYHAVRLKK
ncbi:MAG: glycosyltransferase family 2 protein [Clostridia bacterium]|nr:glycosyltransferase family 2 protein [Clostridia bacterium]